LWRSQRNFLAERMRTLAPPATDGTADGSAGARAASFHDVVMDEVHDLKTEFAKRVGDGVDVSHALNVAAINVMMTITAGRRLHAQQQEFQAVYECVDKITQFMSRAAIMSFLPFLARIVPESVSKMEKGRYHRDRFHMITQKWIREHKEDYRGDRLEDFQDAYLERVFKGEEHFSEDNLGAILREMFVIGVETEACLLRWAFRLLSVHVEAQNRLQEEIDELKGKEEDVTADDKKRYSTVL